MMLAKKLRTYSELVSFSHTIFAMPFAASAVVLSLGVAHEDLTLKKVALMVVCMVAARTSAMAFNRWADRDIDAENPRTKLRHIPKGEVSAREGLWLALGSGAVFLLCASLIGFWPMVLAPVVLAVLLGYSLAKRFTWGAHAWLGVALSLAPGGAWIGMGAAPSWGILSLMGGVVTWLFGFDVLYALQDEAFDRKKGLHSVPARFGTKGTLVLSALAHVLTIAGFAYAGFALHRGAPYFAGVAVCGLLLTYEHLLVGKGNLAKINKAFFDMNAWVSIGFFALTLTDEVLRRRAS
jgi:4-hydroxybenzoate polyprenyltransferase